NVDVAPVEGNQSEPAIAVDPSNPLRLFAAANNDDEDSQNPDATGLTAAYSVDGGLTWVHRKMADGTDGIEPACCDPSAAFDAFGNLFFAYVNADTDAVEVVLSTDGGKTFAPLTEYKGDADQPTVNTGPGSVWVTFAKDAPVVAVGAAVTGLGQVAEFGKVAKMPGSGNANFGDIAVGPDGQVAVTWQKDGGRRGTIGVNVDPDGLGPLPFNKKAVKAATTTVRQFYDVPAQSSRGIDAEAALAWDTSSGPFRGRLYLAYTDDTRAPKHDTDVFLKYSDDNGATWSQPARVNDDAGTNSQFFPRLAVDPTTGRFALSWYDAREDLGDATPPPAGQDPDLPNDEVALYAAWGEPTASGVVLSANARVSGGTTSADASFNSIDLGDYTGLALYGGVMHPAWADNSESAGTIPGPDGELDVYTANVALADLPTATRAFLGGLPARPVDSAPVVALTNKGAPLIAKKAKPFRFVVTATDLDGLDPAGLATAIRVTGPNAFDAAATLLKQKTKRGVTTLTYEIAGPTDGLWTNAANGSYSIDLAAGGVKDAFGNATPAGALGTLVVAVK
ncbi:MAG TPA: sialidase family protein, partial [Humisphaera sp.]